MIPEELLMEVRHAVRTAGAGTAAGWAARAGGWLAALARAYWTGWRWHVAASLSRRNEAERPAAPARWRGAGAPPRLRRRQSVAPRGGERCGTLGAGDGGA